MPWLFSPLADIVFLLAPAFVVALCTVLCDGFGRRDATPWEWLVLVVGIDVAHVYSTLFRTYFDKEERGRYRALLIAIPVACWIGGVVLYSFGRIVFWRVLAYLAVFHFVRQQYGFFRLYSRKEMLGKWERRLDSAAIYLATLYPLVYWHTHRRTFHWFLDGDFVTLPLPGLDKIVLAVYLAVLCGYVAIHVRRPFNLPKHLLLAGTALSWYTGIVLYDGDLAFTVTNVVAHGVPYMALIWFFQRKQGGFRQRWLLPRWIPAFAAMLLVLAYVEESIWDTLIWRDHLQLFGWLGALPKLEDKALLALVVPLLAVPQATHYVLDGFIWRVRDLPNLAK